MHNKYALISMLDKTKRITNMPKANVGNPPKPKKLIKILASTLNSVLQFWIHITSNTFHNRRFVYDFLSEIVQDCVGSLLSLRCPEMKVIKIMDVVLGHFECLYESCCIKDRDCVRTANKSHRTYVNRRCDNKQSCSVEVLKANVTCGYSNSLISNNFERITYNCRDKARSELAFWSYLLNTFPNLTLPNTALRLNN